MAAKTHLWKAACAFTVVLLGSDAAAQEPCTLLCTPSLKVERTVTFAERKAEFELTVGSLDYLVTGRWSFSVVLVIPVSPL